MDALILGYVNDPVYQAQVNQPIGYTQVDLPRKGGLEDNMMATFIDDAIYNFLNSDGTTTNDIDLFFNNAGGIRTDWCARKSGCARHLHLEQHCHRLQGRSLTTRPDAADLRQHVHDPAVWQCHRGRRYDRRANPAVLNQAPLVSNGADPAGGY